MAMYTLLFCLGREKDVTFWRLRLDVLDILHQGSYLLRCMLDGPRGFHAQEGASRVRDPEEVKDSFNLDLSGVYLTTCVKMYI